MRPGRAETKKTRAGLPAVAAWLLVAATAVGPGLLVSGCNKTPTLLINVTADAKVEQYDLSIRDDDTGTVFYTTHFNPVLAPNEVSDDGSGTRDLTKEALKIAVKLSRGGKFTLLMVGVIGPLDGNVPAAGSTQLFWAAHVTVNGPTHVDAKLLTVPVGDDQDRDLWPDGTAFPAHVPEAATYYNGHPDLLDCDDKVDDPVSTTGVTLMVKAADINPFATEICGDNFDEDCNGPGDEACVDKDGDGDPRGDDCNDDDATRHHASARDPFPDPPNCCGYSLGKMGADANVDYLHDQTDPDCHATSCMHDLTLCPMKRCGDGIDESCRGGETNDPADDTTCVIDADCDGYAAAPGGTDCDDTNPAIHPGATEICNNMINESCNPLGPDVGCVACDVDGDGYQRNDPANSCTPPAGMVDCNDDDAGVHPNETKAAGNKEGGLNATGRVATGLKGLCRRYYEVTGSGTPKIAIPSFASYIVGDADCNGVAYEGCPPTSCDADGDGWPADACGMNLSGPFDCDDTNPTIFPGAPDKCGDGVDGSCAGADTTCTTDMDHDGYAPPSDCNDSDPNVHPFATETCNAVDDDCDGDIDEGNPDTTGMPLVASGALPACTNSDVGACGQTKGTCVCSAIVQKGIANAPSHMACPNLPTSATARTPQCFGAGLPHLQTCTDALGVDDDCDGSVTTGTNVATTGNPNGLVDFGSPCGVSLGLCKAGTMAACLQTPTQTWYGNNGAIAGHAHWECSTDAKPGYTTEYCDGYNDTCVDYSPGTLPSNESDADRDGYMACSGCTSLPSGLTLNPSFAGCGDCQDGNPAIHPNAEELCNGVDDNCDGNVDETPNECSMANKTCCSTSGYSCRDLTSDTNACGACNYSCAGRLTSNVCAASACVCKNQGAACSTRNWCDPSMNGGTCELCNTATHCGDTCTACTGANVCKPDGSGCTGCNMDSDCDATHTAGTYYCNGGTCTARVAKGMTCTNTSLGDNIDPECLQTGTPLYCSDGVCCDTKPSMCGGCKQCNGSNNGTCGNAPSGTDPHMTCSASTANCLLADCNGNGSCSASNGTECNGPLCVDNSTESHTYDYECASGMCSTTATTLVSCGDYKCNGNACYTSCTTNAQCQSGKPYCIAGSCYAKPGPGGTCSVNSDCNSGACIGGTCCGTTSRPSSCGNGTTTTTCTGSSLKTYTCHPSAYLTCTSATAACSNSFNCDPGGVICDSTCTCSGNAPCAPPPASDSTAQCVSGTYCATMNGTACSTCNTNQFCGSTCAACVATCSNGVLSGGTCTSGSCGGTTTCSGNYVCASPSACKTNCGMDSDCQVGWCEAGMMTNTCAARIASGMNCDDNDCKISGCKQCDNGSSGVACPTGSGKKCP